MRWRPHAEKALCLLVACIAVCSTTYVSWKKSSRVHEKSNNLYSNVKRYGPTFKDDRAVARYLKYFGRGMMMWRCKNAIQPYWNWKPIPLVELYCETIGVLQKVEWFHEGEKIQLNDRLTQTIVPHFANGRYFSQWIDFKLKIHNATQHDSGTYVFKATSPTGETDQHVIYVDISEKKRKKKKDRGRTGHMYWERKKKKVPTATLR